MSSFRRNTYEIITLVMSSELAWGIWGFLSMGTWRYNLEVCSYQMWAFRRKWDGWMKDCWVGAWRPWFWPFFLKTVLTDIYPLPLGGSVNKLLTYRWWWWRLCWQAVSYSFIIYIFSWFHLIQCYCKKTYLNLSHIALWKSSVWLTFKLNWNFIPLTVSSTKTVNVIFFQFCKHH